METILGSMANFKTEKQKPTLKWLSLPLVLLFFVSTACTFREDKINQSFSPKPNGALNADSKLDFALMQEQVLSRCVNCHAWSKDFSGVKNLMGDIESRTLIIQDMPPLNRGLAPLSECQKALLREWIRVGAPEFTEMRVPALESCGNIGSNPAPEPPPTPAPPSPPPAPVLEPTWSSITTLIFEPKCFRCHTIGGRAEDKPLDSVADLLRQEFIVPGDPQNSYLIEVLNRRGRGQMPPSAPLTAEEVAVIAEWIALGAQP